VAGLVHLRRGVFFIINSCSPGEESAGDRRAVATALCRRDSCSPRQSGAATIFGVKMSPMEKTAREIAQRLRQSGHIAYFAGGCVRDNGPRLPAKDFDMATDATPDVVQKIFPHTYAVGAAFGVVVVVEDGLNFEVATFRSTARISITPSGRCPVFLTGRRRQTPRLHDQRNVF